MTSERPSLSIMIPTWRPDPGHLESAIEGVVTQLNPGPNVQIEIVDDCSPGFDPYAFAVRFDPYPISVHRHDRRLGLAGNWNACLARSRNDWVHLLHQDDLVLDGFYETLLRGIDSNPEVAAAFSASFFVDATGDRWAPNLISMEESGILDDWVQHVFVSLSIQCSAIMVRRDVYETLGGFDSDFSYAVDWDMWKRIAARYPIWYEPAPLACYRMHPDSETSRQRRSGDHIAQVFRSIDRSKALLPPGVASRAVRRARAHYTVFAVEQAFEEINAAREWGLAFRCFRMVRREASIPAIAAALVKVVLRGGVRKLRR